MGSEVDTIKDRLDIAEVVGGYIKLEKAGINFKARCPFHNEKTPSFLVSSSRQSFYCFGCGMKGDIFTFVEEMEGVDFKNALKLLAEKAGIELGSRKGGVTVTRSEKDAVLAVVEEATKFFENNLSSHTEALRYLSSRGILPEVIKKWRIGYAIADWRTLYNHLSSLGYERSLIIKAGLAKTIESGENKNPYDVFRDRIIFPLFDTGGRVIAFSGRALAKDTEPKYLNSPDTVLFTKSEVLYGLDKAKDEIRKKDYTVLVEGQIDLVMSHTVGVTNTVASSGTAFTRAHLERLKRLSKRIILAFDGDTAGDKAAEKSTQLGLSLGMEVKIAKLPQGKDPAELALEDPDKWKDILRQSLTAIEYFLEKILNEEKDVRKQGKLIGKKILPLIKLLPSAMERSHFVSLVSKRTLMREDAVLEDLKNTPAPTVDTVNDEGVEEREKVSTLSRKTIIEERLAEIKTWRKELPADAPELKTFDKEEVELQDHLTTEVLREELSSLLAELSQAERARDSDETMRLMGLIQETHKKIRALEEKRKTV